jgi:predicted transcriptional regulator
MTEDEEAAVNEGLAQLDRGEFVTEEEMEKVWKRLSVR